MRVRMNHHSEGKLRQGERTSGHCLQHFGSSQSKSDKPASAFIEKAQKADLTSNKNDRNAQGKTLAVEKAVRSIVHLHHCAEVSLRSGQLGGSKVCQLDKSEIA